MSDILYPARIEHDAFNGVTLIHCGTDDELFSIDDDCDPLLFHRALKFSREFTDAINDAHDLRAEVERLERKVAELSLMYDMANERCDSAVRSERLLQTALRGLLDLVTYHEPDESGDIDAEYYDACTRARAALEQHE